MLSGKGTQAHLNRIASVSQANPTLWRVWIPTTLTDLQVISLESYSATLLTSSSIAGISEAANQTPNWLVCPDRLLRYRFLANCRRAGSSVPLPELAWPGWCRNNRFHCLLRWQLISVGGTRSGLSREPSLCHSEGWGTGLSSEPTSAS